ATRDCRNRSGTDPCDGWTAVAIEHLRIELLFDTIIRHRQNPTLVVRIPHCLTLHGVGETPAAERFSAIFDELAPRVYAYARPHCDASAAEVVRPDTIRVPWRRWPDVPDDSLPWLLVVARNTMA